MAYRIYVPGGPQEAAVGQDGTLYVTSALSRVLSVITPGATTTVASIPTDSNPGHLAVAPDGTVLVASPGNGTGNGSVSRYAPAAAGAAPTTASAPAPGVTPPQGTEQASGGTQAADAAASPWNSPAGIAGAAGAAAIAVVVFIVAAGRRRKAALRDRVSRQHPPENTHRASKTKASA